MFLDEQASNLAHWVSEYPKYAAHFYGPRRAWYAQKPPPLTGKHVTERQWKQIIKQIGNLSPESNRLTGNQ